jgi:hypothetical protein
VLAGEWVTARGNPDADSRRCARARRCPGSPAEAMAEGGDVEEATDQEDDFDRW